MGTRRKGGNRQPELFARSTKPVIAIEMNHRLVRLTHELDWTELEEVDVQAHLGRALQAAEPHKQRLVKYAKVAHAKTQQLHDTMSKLLPQIRYWIKTGFVAANKIISMHIPKLYSIVRGKAGKKVEFGLQWGISRLRGGFLLARVASDRRELVDARFALTAVDDHIALFGKAPEAYAYDRAGHSEENVALLKAKGVKHVGLAPRGRTRWSVRGAIKDNLVKERAQVEAGIGTVKHSKYGFTKPAARSAPAMAMCGQRAVLGYNLNKFVRGLAKRRNMVLVG